MRPASSTFQSGQRRGDLLERDARLEPRERLPDADVLAVAEVELALRRARHVEPVGIGNSRGSRHAAPVTSATRAPCGIVTPCARHVAHRHAPLELARRVVAQHLFDRVRQARRRVLEHPAPLVRVLRAGRRPGCRSASRSSPRRPPASSVVKPATSSSREACASRPSGSVVLGLRDHGDQVFAAAACAAPRAARARARATARACRGSPSRGRPVSGSRSRPLSTVRRYQSRSASGMPSSTLITSIGSFTENSCWTSKRFSPRSGSR